MIKQISHVAIGVRDMDLALVFWRDFLGLKVAVDHEEKWDHVGVHRRAVYLRWEEGVGASYVVLSVDLNQEPFGSPAVLNQVGVHHFALAVDDLAAYVERARDMQVPFASVVSDNDAVLSGEAGGGYVRTVLLQDPDGNYVQLDQWLALYPAPPLAKPEATAA